MKGNSKSEIRNSKQELSPKFDSGAAYSNPNLIRISNFGFRILTLALLCLTLPAFSTTNISAGDDIPKLRPPRGEIPPTFWEQYQIWVLLGSIFIAVLVGIIVWFLTRPKPPIIIPSEVRAKQALDLLLTKPEDGFVLSQVSQVTRHYIAEAFALPSGELTTTEFCRLIAGHEGIGPELAGAISEFLRRCDEKKFTPSPPAVPIAAAATALKLVESAQSRQSELRRRAQEVSAA
jgi:hypothetical protein